MKSRLMLVLLISLVISMVAGSLCFAQISTVSASVRGTGTIKVGTSVGVFNINIAQLSTGLVGGFEFGIASTTASSGVYIVSKTLTSLNVSNGTATVTATGTINGRAADLTMVAHNGGAGVGTLDISASPVPPMTWPSVDYSGTVVAGGIIVTPTPILQGSAYGAGSIAASATDVGVFNFKATDVNNVVYGMIQYVDYNKAVAASAIQLRDRIIVPAVKSLTINGNTAVLIGPGTCNGKPVIVKVTAVDNSMLANPVPIPDSFSITAVDANMQIVYSAGPAPLKSGDIVVR